MSRRAFTGEVCTGDEIEKIQSLIAAANAASGLSIEFLEDGSEAFGSLKKS